MIDEAAVAVLQGLQALQSCRCCLVRQPINKLMKPYSRRGKTEILADMLKDCFNIQLELDSNECGICQECTGHLRDASDFKRQVEHSQQDLRRQLKIALEIIDNDPIVKTEIPDEDIKTEIGDEEVCNDIDADDQLAESDNKPAASDDQLAASDDNKANAEPTSIAPNGQAPPCAVRLTDAAREQLAMTCSVRLERLSSIKCVKCPLTFHHHSSLAAHMIEAHASSSAHAKDTSNELFTEKYEFTKHVQTHKTMLSVNGLTKSQEVKLKNKTAEKRFICEVCNKQFAQYSNLKSHTRQHTGEKPYACGSCDKRFNFYAGLKAHQYKHTGVKPHKCEICDKTFTRLHNLQIHQRVHAGYKPLKCEKCDMKFNRLCDLNVHIQRIHMKVRPFTCDICKKQFKMKRDLKFHIITHTEQNPFRPFPCNICPKGFSSRKDLKKHITVHTREKPYICDSCGMHYSDRQKLIKHLRTRCKKINQTRSEIHSCKICHKMFKNVGALKEHKRVHKTKYCCEICGTSYTKKTYLIKHLEKHAHRE